MKTSRTRHSKKILLRRVLFAVTLTLLIATVVFLLLVAFKVKLQYNSIPPTIQSTAIQKKRIKVELPIRLSIPILNVDAVIYYVGIKSDGTMNVEKDPDKVAWYEFGPRPGENGSAVIAGHYGWIGNKGSVFNDLHTLKKGDEVSVIDVKGNNIVFVVRESRKYDPNADATIVFKSNDGKAHLNLITCEGVWIESQKTYSDRLVVFTDKK